MKKQTFKEVIKKYIGLKIASGNWPEGYKVPSENSLSSKFNCSRLTARNALQVFVQAGAITPHQGLGYRVSSSGSNSLLKQFSKEISDKTKTSATKIDFLLKDFKENIHDTKIYKTTGFKKEYFKNNELVMSQFSILNNNEVWTFDFKKINKSLINYLISIGIFPAASNQELVFGNHKIFNDDAKKLGWKENDYPILISKLESVDGWIEISFRLFSQKDFKFTRRQSFIF